MLLHRKVAIVNIYDDGWIKYVEIKITDKKINNDLLKQWVALSSLYWIKKPATQNQQTVLLISTQCHGEDYTNNVIRSYNRLSWVINDILTRIKVNMNDAEMPLPAEKEFTQLIYNY